MKGPILLILFLVILIAGCTSSNKIHVVSNSMEPTIKKGEIVTIEKVDTSQIKVDDIVMFKPDSRTIFAASASAQTLYSADGVTLPGTKTAPPITIILEISFEKSEPALKTSAKFVNGPVATRVISFG